MTRSVLQVIFAGYFQKPFFRELLMYAFEKETSCGTSFEVEKLSLNLCDPTFLKITLRGAFQILSKN